MDRGSHSGGVQMDGRRPTQAALASERDRSKLNNKLGRNAARTGQFRAVAYSPAPCRIVQCNISSQRNIERCVPMLQPSLGVSSLDLGRPSGRPLF